MRIEHWFYSIPLRLRSLFRRRRVEQESDEELQYHLGRRIEEERARGLAPQEARHAGLRAMEGLEQREEECRQARRVNSVEDSARGLRHAFRMLKKNRGFCDGRDPIARAGHCRG